MKVNAIRKYAQWTIGIKVIIVAIPIVILLVVVNRRTLLFSNSTITYRPGQLHSLISLGSGQVIKTADPLPYSWSLVKDTLDIRAWLPRVIPTVKVQATIATSNAEYISWVAHQVDSLGDISTIVWSKALNKLDWPHTTVNGITLWQRPSSESKTVQAFTSLSDFEQHSPDMRQVAVVGVDPFSYASQQNYQPSRTPLTLPFAVRGRQVIYVYAANEDLSISFNKIDRNIQPGSDKIRIRVSRADEVDDREWLYERIISDDGNRSSDGQPGKPQSASIDIKQVEPGMYRVEMDCTKDVLIENLTSMQHVLGFADSFYPAAGPGYKRYISDITFSPVTISTNVSQLEVAADHIQGKQALQIGNQKVALKNPQVFTPVSLKTSTTQFVIGKADVQFKNFDGLITVAPFTLPVSGATTLSLYPKLNLENFDYVVAKYSPKSSSSSLLVDEEYTQSDLLITSNQSLAFAVMVPGLQANNYQVSLKKVKITYVRGSLSWSKVWHRMKVFFGGMK